MAYSPNLRITLIDTGTQAGIWGDTTNTNLGSLLEGAISGYTEVAVTGPNQAFISNSGAPDQARMALIKLTTTTTAAFNIYAPNTPKMYLIWNSTSYTATLYPATQNTTVASGAGVDIAAGTKQIIWTDGDNFYSIASNLLPVIADLPMNGYKITNLAAPTNAGDALAYGSSLGAITATTATFSGLATFNSGITGTIGLTTPSGSKFTYAYTAPVATTFSAIAMAFDCSLSNVFTVTLTANVTIAPIYTNPHDGQTINIFITQDATGSRTMTWGTLVKFAGGATQSVLTTTANAVDLVVLTYRSTTGFWYASLLKAFT